MATPEQLARIRATYTPGRRVRFVGYGQRDARSLDAGALGTIRSVDDLGTVHIEWDNGLLLGCIMVPTDSSEPDELEVLED